MGLTSEAGRALIEPFCDSFDKEAKPTGGSGLTPDPPRPARGNSPVSLMPIRLVPRRGFCRPIQVLLLAVILGHLASACSGKRQPPQPSAATWPELELLEAALTDCSELFESGKTAEVRLRRRRLLEVGWAVNMKTLPSGSVNVETLRQLLGDLSSKVNRLASPEVNTTMIRTG